MQQHRSTPVSIPRRVGGAPAGPRYSDSWELSWSSPGAMDSSTASSAGLDDTLTLKVQGRSTEELDVFIATGYWPQPLVGPVGASPRPPLGEQGNKGIVQQLQMQALESQLHYLDQQADRIRACLEYKTQRTVAGRPVQQEPRWIGQLLQELRGAGGP